MFMNKKEYQVYLKELAKVYKSKNLVSAKKALEVMSSEQYMHELMEFLAEKKIPKKFRDVSGILFWPIPMYFPLLLAKVLFLIEQEVFKLRANRQWTKAKKLVDIRKIYVRISCGQEKIEGEEMSDLSGDHCHIYIEDHKDIYKLPKSFEKSAVWTVLFRKLLSNKKLFETLGAISENEIGSTAEQLASVKYKIFTAQKFYRLHTVAEEEHARLSQEMIKIVMSEKDWARDFIFGQILHRVLYIKAVL